MKRPNAQPVFEIVDRVAPELAARAAAHDADNTFVGDGYALLKDAGFFGAGVPADLGGGDASHGELCEALRRLGRACPATALAAAMHSHLVAAAVWRYRHGKGGDALLRRVAEEGIVLVSTGAGDWLESNGQLTRDGEGYRLNARKIFASGSPAGDLLVTSAVYADPVEGEQVLHFAVPLRAAGITVGRDWDTLGMRGTGSHTVQVEGAFVPDASIVLKRPRKGWHPVWSIVLTVAAPLYMAPYLGVAEAARDRAVEHARKVRDREDIPLLVGEMDNVLAMARLAFADLIANAANYEFSPALEMATRALTSKTILADAAIRTVDKAMEVVGGASYFRSTGLERLFRDVHGGSHHPLPEKRQQRLTGRVALGLDPV